MPKTSNNRANNQYIGKYFEIAITSKIKGEIKNPNPMDYEDTCDYNFSKEEIQTLNNQAKFIADYIGYDSTANRVGNHTISGIGDIILNNNIKLEIKRVSSGSGTYHNTSIYYFTDFGFDFKDYMKKFQLHETIEKYFPNANVNYNNNSPVTQQMSSLIRHSKNYGYEEIKKVDEQIRITFVQDLVKFFRANPEKTQNFYQDMVNKQKRKSHIISIPDRFIVYNYNKNSIDEINLDKIKQNPDTNIYVNDFGFCISNLRIQIGWQNGNGLNNPTIRVFLK